MSHTFDRYFNSNSINRSIFSKSFSQNLYMTRRYLLAGDVHMSKEKRQDSTCSSNSSSMNAFFFLCDKCFNLREKSEDVQRRMKKLMQAKALQK